VRVVIGEDQALLREGLCQLLSNEGFDVVALAADATDLVRKAKAHRPDVVVADVQMPPGNLTDGLDAALLIRRALPGTGVLLLTQFLDEAYAVELMQEGAEGVGYLLKDRVGDLKTLSDAITRVAGGGSVLDPEVVRRAVLRGRQDDPIGSLTARERDVLELMAQGKSNQGIAETLVVTPGAVEKHVTNIFSKLGLEAEPSEHRRVLAVLRFLRR
jgi:DNA-binding NarL/FixJ family response regulator